MVFRNFHIATGNRFLCVCSRMLKDHTLSSTLSEKQEIKENLHPLPAVPPALIILIVLLTVVVWFSN